MVAAHAPKRTCRSVLAARLRMVAADAVAAGAGEDEWRLLRLATRAELGAFSEYRATRLAPKGDLVDWLTEIEHPEVRDSARAVAAEVLAGWYDGDEPPPGADDLDHAEYLVLAWLHRYAVVYGRSPMLAEMAAGLTWEVERVALTLEQLARKGATANVGGRRGWVATRSP